MYCTCKIFVKHYIDLQLVCHVVLACPGTLYLVSMKLVWVVGCGDRRLKLNRHISWAHPLCSSSYWPWLPTSSQPLTLELKDLPWHGQLIHFSHDEHDLTLTVPKYFFIKKRKRKRSTVWNYWSLIFKQMQVGLRACIIDTLSVQNWNSSNLFWILNL